MLPIQASECAFSAPAIPSTENMEMGIAIEVGARILTAVCTCGMPAYHAAGERTPVCRTGCAVGNTKQPAAYSHVRHNMATKNFACTHQRDAQHLRLRGTCAGADGCQGFMACPVAQGCSSGPVAAEQGWNRNCVNSKALCSLVNFSSSRCAQPPPPKPLRFLHSDWSHLAVTPVASVTSSDPS
jgi:hypothetical protein